MTDQTDTTAMRDAVSNKIRALLIAALLCLSLSGCIPLLVGGLVGYEIAKDREEPR